jgi:predicted acetyltransferase
VRGSFRTPVNFAPAAVAAYTHCMPIQLRWVGTDEIERVAQTRLRCYAKTGGEIDALTDWARKDPRSIAGDYLLAESDGLAVGTATHLSLTMHVRGGSIPVQGVAWVGAIRTARRRPGDGVATTVMKEMVRHARERGDVASALMPFRASYYQHFGYGVVERRCDWTVPLSVLPRGDGGDFRFYEPSDFEARNRLACDFAAAAQCDFDISDEFWRIADETAAKDGFDLIERRGDGPADTYFRLSHQQTDGKDIARIGGIFYRDPAALRRLLGFLSTLKDQYASAALTLPSDVPLNFLLTEPQLPHRSVNHAVATVHPYTRMQVRVLDHKRFLGALRWPAGIEGSTTVAVAECEGHTSRFRLDVHGGRAAVTPIDAGGDFQCTDAIWAAVACGDMTATAAGRYGLAVANESSCKLLDALAVGPVPFSNLYF